MPGSIREVWLPWLPWLLDVVEEVEVVEEEVEEVVVVLFGLEEGKVEAKVQPRWYSALEQMRSRPTTAVTRWPPLE